jgi:hypothetical protein
VCAAGAGALPNHHHKRGDAINIIRANRPTVVHHHFPWNDCTTLIGEPDGGCRVGTWPDCTPPPTNGGGTLPATGSLWVLLLLGWATGGLLVGLWFCRIAARRDDLP